MGMKDPPAHGNGDRKDNAVARQDEKKQQRRDGKKREHEREETRADEAGTGTGSAKSPSERIQRKAAHDLTDVAAPSIYAARFSTESVTR